MFKLKENDLVSKLKCVYVDENGNRAAYIRKPDKNEAVIKIRNDEKNIRFDPVVIHTDHPGDGCQMDYHFDKHDESITKEYLESTIENTKVLLNHLVGLENAIRLLDMNPVIMANYIGLEADMSIDEKKEAASAAKLNLLAQYEELAGLSKI